MQRLIVQEMAAARRLDKWCKSGVLGSPRVFTGAAMLISVL